MSAQSDYVVTVKRPGLFLAIVCLLFTARAGFAVSTNVVWQSVGISEFMATNRNTVLDADGDASGWIELFNPTTNSVNLKNWALTTDTNNLQFWRFPNVVLLEAKDANGSDNYLVVFASGKNRAINTNELHTNFQLPAAGGYLALVDPKTNVVSVFNSYPPQTSDVAFGRDAVNPNLTGYFPEATPGEPNSIAGANFSAPVTFSRSGGTFVALFNLTLASAAGATNIRYTLDGSAPTPDSAAYTNALAITQSVQVRARAFGPGLMPGPLHSETYLQLDASLLAVTSSLPAVVIYNFGAGAVPLRSSTNSLRQPVNIAFYEPQNGLTSLTNPPAVATRAGIQIHGNSTASLPKQSFAVEFWDDFGNDQNFSPLGLPPESDFILYAPNQFEPVLIHNPLMYQLSNEAGRYAPRTRFVEVYLNTNGAAVSASDYHGIYVLEEKVKWDDNRVNIHKLHSVDNLHPEDNSLDNVTGGYLLQIDRTDPGESGFEGARQSIVYGYPKETELNTPQRAPQKEYLQDYFDAFSTALYGLSFTNPVTGYRPFVDVPSWIDFHIFNVTAFNADALRFSTYVYKDRTNNLMFGPLWDFDRSQGSTDGRDFNPLVWTVSTASDVFNYGWWDRLFTDIDFWQAWIDRYQDLRTGVLSTNHIYAAVDALVAQVRPQQPREAARWPTQTSPRSGTIRVSNYAYTFPGTYQGEVDFLKKWHADRLNFIDTNFLARPVFGNNSGFTVPGATMAIAAPPGATIYYTTNGTDPRLAAGRLSPSALVYSVPIELNTNLSIVARAYDVNHHNLTGTLKPPLSSPWSGPVTEHFGPASPPLITVAPASLDAYIGQSLTLTVQATGNPVPAYQWYFSNAPLAGQTNGQLILPLLQTNQSGWYSVLVTNLAGGTNVPVSLTVTPKPKLVVTEVMSSEAKKASGVTISTSDWWELSNLGNFSVNLRGYRFDDDHNSFSDAETITNEVALAPGESIILVEDMRADDFRTWWGRTNLPAGLKIITYPNIGFSADGDAIHLWNAAAASIADVVTSVTFPAATKGVTFGYNPATGVFGALSVPGQNGAFAAPVNGDLGSPGMILGPPNFAPVVFSRGDGFRLSFETQSNLNYTIQYKNNLSEPTWLTYTNFIAHSNSFLVNDGSATTNLKRFFRLLVAP